MFFAKFHSHRVQNEKVMTENLSQLKAPSINDGATVMLANFGLKIRPFWDFNDVTAEGVKTTRSNHLKFRLF